MSTRLPVILRRFETRRAKRLKLLLDACVWGGAKTELESLDHDVVSCSDWDNDPGDEAILDAAIREGRVLVTLDKDFGEIAVVRGIAHSGIVRLVGFAEAVGE